jgi:hypothetical protein
VTYDVEGYEIAKIMTTSSTPLITIITPSFNHAPYIRETVDSVFAQDWPSIEHIVVDGGSTDGTVAILKEYEGKYPGRFRWVSEPDRGQAHAFNKGVAMASGSIIGWQNSDDYYFPNVFGMLVAPLASDPTASAVFGRSFKIGANGRILGEFPVGTFTLASLLKGVIVIANQSAFFRKEALLVVGGVSEDLHYALDRDLCLRLGLTHRIVYAPVIGGAWRILPEAKTSTGYLKARQELIETYRRLTANPALQAAERPIVARAHTEFIMDALAVALADGLEADAQSLADSLCDNISISDIYLLLHLLFNASRQRQTVPEFQSSSLILKEVCRLHGLADTEVLARLFGLVLALNSRPTSMRTLSVRLRTLALALRSDRRWWVATNTGKRILLENAFGSRAVDGLLAARNWARLLSLNIWLRTELIAQVRHGHIDAMLRRLLACVSRRTM